MKAFGNSNIGLVRKVNEDAFYYQEYYEKGRPFLCVIADGMGGHNAGEVASKMAISHIIDFFRNNLDKDEDNQRDYASFVKKAFIYTNDKVYSSSIENRNYIGMGTTLSLALIIDNQIIIGHVGDSRIYLVKDKSVEKLTTDHSYVAELIKNGTIKPEDAKNHPQKNLITRAIGTGTTIDVDIIVAELKDANYIIMCTDGLSNVLKEVEIMDVVMLKKDIEEKCNELIESANDKGGYDNITVIIIEVDGGGQDHDR